MWYLSEIMLTFAGIKKCDTQIINSCVDKK